MTPTEALRGVLERIERVRATAGGVAAVEEGRRTSACDVYPKERSE